MNTHPLDVAREYFPDESREFLEALIWEETGYPGFFNPKKGKTVEDYFREQLYIAQKKRYKLAKRIWIMLRRRIK